MAPPTTDLILAGLVLGTVVVVMVYAIVRLRRHRERLKRDLDASPEIAGDRAHNQLRLIESEADILEREGIDASRPRALIAEAQARVEAHDYLRAITIGRSAHEQMVELRRSAREPTRPNSSSTAPPPLSARLFRPEPLASRFPSQLSVPDGNPSETSPESPVAPRLAKNRAESHFQMNLLAQEIERMRAQNPGDPRVAEGERLLAQSQTAYQAAAYTEALRVGIRGRRVIGTHVDTLPLPPVAGASSTKASALGSTGPRPLPSSSSESPCPKCGRPTRPTDRYCRSCGATLRGAECPRCGQHLIEADQYCGSCGAPVGA